MYNTSTAYKAEIKKPSRSFECKITIGEIVYFNDDIVDVILDGNIQPSDGFIIGATTSQTLDLTLINKGDIIFNTNQIKLEIGLKIGDTIEYILMGFYNIDEVEKTDYTIKFTAYDNMIKFEKPYFSNLGDTPTLQQVVNELVTITGVQFIGSLPTYTVKKLEGFTCREVLSNVASLCGGNAIITRDGKFKIVSLIDINYSVVADNYIDYKREETKYKIGKISCQVGEEVLSKGSLGTDSMELQFENPWITPTILTDIYNKLNGFEYLGYSMKWQGDLSLDTGDIITVTDLRGVVRKHPILSQKFTYTGGLTSELAAKGESKNKNSFSSSGSTANKVNRVVTDLLLVNEALINKANIQDLQAVSIRTQTLETKTATIETAIIGVAYVSDLNTINANINNLIAMDATINTALINKANIIDLNTAVGRITTLESSKANITDLTVTNANITNLTSKVATIDTLINGNITSANMAAGAIKANDAVIANGAISSAQIISLDVAKINAGDISTNKFRIVSNNGNMLISDNTIQIKDSTRVRVQIGKDASNDYNMYVWDASGNLMFDATGLKASGIKSKIIRDDMVSDTANISGSKIEKESLIVQINGATTTLKGSRVKLDAENQTLDVAFTSLKSTVTTTANTVSSQGTAISTIQGQISSKIWQTDITNAVNNINIGGRNLVKNSTFNLQGDSWNSIPLSPQYTISTPETDKPKSNILIMDYPASSAASYLYNNQRVLVKADETENLMLSFDIFITANGDVLDNVLISSNRLVSTASGVDWTVIADIYFSHIKSQITYGKWSRVVISRAIPNNSTKKYLITGLYRSNVTSQTKYRLREIKIELGNKATDWTPAPEDVESQIVVINDKYSTLTQTIDGITTSVASLNSKIDTTNGNVTLVDNKVSTLTQTVNGLSSTVTSVQQNYLTKSDASTTYSTNTRVSTLEQTVNGLNSTIASVQTNYLTKADATTTYSTNTRVATLEQSVTGLSSTISSVQTTANSKKRVFTATPTTPYDVGDLWVSTNGTGDLMTCKTARSSGAYTSSDWVKGVKYTDDTTANNVQTNLNTTNSNLSSLTNRVSTAESSITQVNNSINLKVNTSDFTSYQTTVTNSLNSKANQSSLDTTNSNLSSLTTRVSSTESSISILQNQISLKVEQSHITTAVNNIQIGGRNLFLNSGNFGTQLPTSFTNNGGGYTLDTSEKWNGYNTIRTTVGAGITGSWYTLENNVEYTYSVMLKSSIAFTGNTSTPIHYWAGLNNIGQGKIAVVKSDTSYTSSDLGKYKLLYVTFKLTGDANSFKPFVYTNAFTSTFNIAYLKLEKGNKATDWTPSIEDVTTETDTKINAAKAEIKVTTDSITSSVSSIQSSVNSLGTRMSTAESSITTLNNSISLKVNTTDFNSYKTTNDSAVNSKASQTALNTTNSNVTTLTTRVSTAESSISILQGQIVSKVSQTEIDTSINSMQIGGRNLIRSTDFKTLNTAVYSQRNNYATLSVDAVESYEGVNSLKIVTNVVGANGTDLALATLKPDRVGTYNVRISFYAKSNVSNNRFYFRWGYGSFLDPITLTSNWQKYEIQCNATPIHGSALHPYLTQIGTVWISKLMIEYGTKSSDWTPAPEDIQGQIDSTNSRINTQETSITQLSNSIALKVDTSTYNSKMSNLDGSISSLNTRMNSAELKITDSAIINTVSATINSAKNEAINSANANTANQLTNYSTKSEMNLTAENLTLKFTSSGGYNLLRNSAFANKGIAEWWFWGPCSKWWDSNYYSKVGDMYIANSSTGPGGLMQTGVPIKPNTVYTFSVAATKEGNVKGGGVVFEYTSDEGGGVNITSQAIGLNFNGNRNSYTFTTPNNSAIKFAKVGFRHEGSTSSSGGYLMYINKPCLTEGELAIWSSHPAEVIDGNTQINGNGVTITNGALNVKNSNGLVTIDGSSNIFKIHSVVDLNLDAGTNLDYSYSFVHGMGYVPAFQAYQVDTPSSVGGNIALPAINISGGTSSTFNVVGLIRASADNNRVYITYRRTSTSVGSTFKVRIFIFREALL